jgi:hypothetical protein
MSNNNKSKKPPPKSAPVPDGNATKPPQKSPTSAPDGDDASSAKMHEEVLALIREELMAMAGKSKLTPPAGQVAAAVGRLSSDSTKVVVA